MLFPSLYDIIWLCIVRLAFSFSLPAALLHLFPHSPRCSLFYTLHLLSAAFRHFDRGVMLFEASWTSLTSYCLLTLDPLTSFYSCIFCFRLRRAASPLLTAHSATWLPLILSSFYFLRFSHILVLILASYLLGSWYAIFLETLPCFIPRITTDDPSARESSRPHFIVDLRDPCWLHHLLTHHCSFHHAWHMSLLSWLVPGISQRTHDLFVLASIRLILTARTNLDNSVNP